MFIKQFISYTLAILMLLNLTACSFSEESSLLANKDQAKKLDFSDSEELGDKEYAEIKEYIFSVSEPPYTIRYTSGEAYPYATKEVNYLLEKGLKAIPVLVKETKKLYDESVAAADPNIGVTSKDAEIWSYTLIYCSASLQLLRIPWWMCTDDASGKHLRDFWREAQPSIITILNSEIPTEEKVTKISQYGIIAIPYAKKEIENGNEQFEDVFKCLGLHKSAGEWASIVHSDDFSAYAESQIKKNKYTNPDYDYIFQYSLCEMLQKDYGNFDYKVWLSENEDDLNIVLKFLDEFCAEYEAENK